MNREDWWWVGLAGLALWIWMIERRCGRRVSVSVVGGGSSSPAQVVNFPQSGSSDCGCSSQ